MLSDRMRLIRSIRLSSKTPTFHLHSDTLYLILIYQWRDAYSNLEFSRILRQRLTDKQTRKMGNFLTLIVFDFDDTLFPTTFMSDNNYSDSGIRRSELPPEVQQALDNIEQAAINALRESKRHGTVKIVSNGSMLWIETASARFMPQFWDVVRDLNIEVISANDRRYGRHVYSSNAIHWKTHEFRAILRDMKRRRRPF